MERLYFAVAGLGLVAATFGTLRNVAKYYLQVEKNEDLQLRFLKTGSSIFEILKVVILDLGTSLLIVSILPESQAVRSFDLPASFWNFVPRLGLAIISEELAFRICPWIILCYLRLKREQEPQVEKTSVLIAILISVFFGLIHLMNYKNHDLWIVLSTSSQMIGGLFYWYLVEKHGLLSSMLAHAAFNITIFALIKILPT